MFPLSNWTELDIWTYIRDEEIDRLPLYYAHRREVVERNGMLLAVNRSSSRAAGETPFEATVRFRTIGDATCTGCVESHAGDPPDVADEVAAARITERGRDPGRRPDLRSRYGRPQEGGLLLASTPAPSDRDRRLGR